MEILYVFLEDNFDMETSLLIPFEEIRNILKEILLKQGFINEHADSIATIFTESNRDGYPSHGINRFPLFIRGIRRGYIKTDQVAVPLQTFGALERWDGQLGAGMLNARICMQKAVSLASGYGIGCVALRNTNHWMRGGTYGWQAVDANFGAICWTNTTPNMPPWGGRKAHTGNNPLVIAIHGPDDIPLVLDMSLSQYSYGKLDTYKRAGERLPFPGGLDEQGNMLYDPANILRTGQLLPIGLWKGSALSLILDLMAALLSSGQTSLHIGRQSHEYGLSQVFIAFDLPRLISDEVRNQLIHEVVEYYKASGTDVRFPGEQTLARREKAMREGIAVDPGYWEEILQLSGR